MDKKFLYVSLFSLSWALNIVLGRYILKLGMLVLTLTYETLFFSSIMIFAYILISTPKAFSKGSKKSHTGAIISGVIGGGLANIFGNLGLQLSTAVNYGFLIKTAGAFNVVLAYLILQEPIGNAKGFLLFLMLVGSYVLSTNGQLITPHVGDILILLAALGYALASVLNRKVLKKDMDPNMVSLYRACFGFIVSFTVAMLLGGNRIQFQFLNLVLLAAFLQALIFIFLNKTLQVASSSYLGMMSMSVPVIVAIVAIPAFGETQTLIQWIGGALIILGGFLTETRKVAHHA